MSDPPPQNPAHLPLQQFGLKESAYERPNQNWVCGHLCAGSPCAIGPDAKGHCIATCECRPLKKGDRWFCTRRDASSAPNPCSSGPLPDGSCAHPISKCSPVRSIRGKRKQCAMAAFALSVGVLCYFLFGPQKFAFVDPGPLSSAHAEVLKSNHSSNCQACHAAGQPSVSSWLHLAMSTTVGAVQNEKCLACHGAQLGANAALVHSLPKTTLDRMTAAAKPTWVSDVQLLASFAPNVPKTPQGELACATCHQEHQGRHASLTSMSDTSCQVCHKSQFQSFAVGHPDFKSVRHDHAGILFDHAIHQPLMPGGKLDCAQCHRPDPAGQTMLLTSFEQACAGCHDQGKIDHHGEQIRGDIRVVLQLPAMSLEDAGNWPDDSLAPGTALTPVLQFLIAGDEDPTAVQALKSLASDTVANGSADDWDTDAKTKAQLAASIKRIVKELSLDDDPPPHPSNRELLRARIARAAGLPLTSPAVSALLDQLNSSQTIATAWQQRTLPQLADDLAGKLPPATKTPPDATPWMPPTDASAWFIDTSAVSVNYRPAHADAFDKSWLDLLAASATHTAASKITAAMPDQDFLTNLRLRLLTHQAGSCIKCHAIQPQLDAYVINWYPTGHAARDSGFFKFDHKPHLTLFPGQDNCSACHGLQTANSPAPVADATLFPPPAPNHGLAPHDKSSCAACHTPSAAPDSCLTCHEYHLSN